MKWYDYLCIWTMLFLHSLGLAYSGYRYKQTQEQIQFAHMRSSSLETRMERVEGITGTLTNNVTRLILKETK